MSEKATFFQGRRVSVYCKGGRLVKDKKTDIRSWRLKLALTLDAEDAHACGGGAILSNYQQIQARENAIGKIEIDGCVGGHVVTFFPTSQQEAEPIIRLDRSFIDKLAMTYADGLTELWMVCEHENTDALHRFVKDYAFTRFFVEFIPAQRSLFDAGELVKEMAKDATGTLQDLADRDGISMSLHHAGQKLAEFKPKQSSKQRAN